MRMTMERADKILNDFICVDFNASYKKFLWANLMPIINKRYGNMSGLLNGREPEIFSGPLQL